jgi:glucose-6-phosphate isomerase
VRAAAERGLDLSIDASAMRFEYGAEVFGPLPELRRLDGVRSSLLDPDCKGPDPPYGIVMDVGCEEHRGTLIERHLLFGAVAFAAGLLGREPVRTQGHIHARARHSGWSPPELLEIWQGRALVYAQERCGDDPGRCFAVFAEEGEHVIIPPGWAHFVANADPSREMAFLALCDREYGFEYEEVRRRGGLAWFPVWEGETFAWRANHAYRPSTLRAGRPRECEEFRVRAGVPLYTQFAEDPAALGWVAEPQEMALAWEGFYPIEGTGQSVASGDAQKSTGL